MRVLLIDTPSSALIAHADVLSRQASDVILAYSRQTVTEAFSSSRPYDLIVLNLKKETAAWGLPEAIRQFGHEAATIVFHDPHHQQELALFGPLPRCEYVPRSTDQAMIDRMAQRLTAWTTAALTSPPLNGGKPQKWPVFPEPIIGRSKKMLEVFALIEKVAPGNANVCIFGESGTGKELIARAIHYNSPRRDRPLITFDCTAVPEGLVESHLFGHVKGAFTTAIDNREGVFSLANTGTLFIDELGEFGLPLQAKLLRVIQSREFLKVGGTKPQKTDIRLITATNKDLRKAVAAGTFREDLYYRIVVVTIYLPPLRERKEDIPLLVDHFVKKFSRIHRKPLAMVTPRALDFLMEYLWPGNVRQLENCIEQAVVLTENDTVDVDVLPFSTGTELDVETPILPKPGLSLRELERRYILKTLEEVGGNRTRAAKILGISLRGLQYKLKSYTFDEAHEGASEVHMSESQQKTLRGALQ
ncbi:MAG TPA: sigma 54-interacting transcriptional regulator [Methylomirabilota bacterium]|nr:sigma 54-interacting transcriptional regulator [Methylomirabilota bacterium]